MANLATVARLGPTEEDRLAYYSTARNGQDWDIYVMDPDSSEEEPKRVLEDSGAWVVSDWSPDDKINSSW